MKNEHRIFDRRNFIKNSSVLALGTGSLLTLAQTASADSLTNQDDINIIGPKEGFSPQVGTLVSMMNWMRMVILSPVKEMSVLDRMRFMSINNSYAPSYLISIMSQSG